MAVLAGLANSFFFLDPTFLVQNCLARPCGSCSPHFFFYCLSPCLAFSIIDFRVEYGRVFLSRIFKYDTAQFPVANLPFYMYLALHYAIITPNYNMQNPLPEI